MKQAPTSGPRSALRRAPGVSEILAGLALAILAATSGTARADPPAPDAAAARSLHALFREAWQRDLRDDPLLASEQGDTRFDDRWPDLSRRALDARAAVDARTLARLHKLDRARLSEADRLNYDLFAREYETRLAARPFRPELWRINQRGGIQTLSQTAEILPFRTVRDYQNWIARLNRVGVLVDQHIELLRQAVREGRTQPRVVMQRIPAQIAAQVVVEAEDSPFYTPFKSFPDAIGASDRQRLERAARRAIADIVVPAYRRLQQAFENEYLPATRSTVGISDTPQGREYYDFLIRYHTTRSDLTADRIHEIGLAEVGRIRSEMQQVMQQVGFAGSLGEFFAYLRSDPKFYYATPEELFASYQAIMKRIDPELPRLFGRLPRTPYGLRAIPAILAPDTTTAYYQPPSADGSRPGYYYVNLYRPEVRPKFEMEVLSVHEAVPGHHLQIALALEQARMPDFRRNAGYTAYVEGWALYSERLGYELGLYRDPYSRFGQLTYDMWRAVRLVVDTGLHAKGWTREQAIRYFIDNAPKTEADIVNEIDRYIAWPGQALAYKIGQLEILELRAEAEQRLGHRFDIRAFHDALLSTGAVPLDVLSATVRAWIGRQALGQERGR